MLAWASCSENHDVVQSKSDQLVFTLYFLKCPPPTKSRKALDKFFCPDEYDELWMSIAKLAKSTKSRILHYFITKFIFLNLIQKCTRCNRFNSDDQELVSLSIDEEATLAYIGGYLIRALIKKISSRNLLHS